MCLEEKYALECMREILVSLTNEASVCEVENARYHHNTEYYKAASVVQYGILSLEHLNRLGILDYSSSDLKVMSDTESHVNGVDGVSLAVVGLTDLYPDEDEYDPFCLTQVDFLVDSGIKTYRSSINYGNEFVSRDSVGPKYFRAIDIRLLEYFDTVCDEQDGNYKNNMIIKAIEKYNCISEIARTLENMDLNIPIRERSFNRSYGLDVKKLVRIPKLNLKR